MLVPLDREILPTVREWILDGDIREVVGTIRIPSDVEHEAWYERAVTDPTRTVRVIRDRERNRPVGVCGLMVADPIARSAELWIYVAVGQGEGTGAAAVEELLREGFHTLALHRVFVRVFGFNEGGRAFFRSVGFRDEGVERDGVFKRGRFHDVWRLSMLADEWGVG